MTEKSFAQVFFDSLSLIITYRPSSKQPTKLYINKNQVFANDLFRLAKKHELMAPLKEVSKEHFFELQDNDIFAMKVLVELNKLFEKKYEEETNDKDSAEEFEAAQQALFTTYFNTSIATPLAKLKVVIIPDKSKAVYLHDEENNISYNYNYDVVMSTLQRLIPHKGVYAMYLAQQAVQCKEIYSPRAPRFTQDETGHHCYNTYNLPAWRVGWKPDPSVKELHPRTKEFLNHLTNNSQIDFDMIASWIRDAVFSRAALILGLRAEPGSGKNLLIENLTANLVGCGAGSNNYFKGTRNFLESTFQGPIKRYQLIFQDEINLTEARSETFKDWNNEKGNGDDKYMTSGGPVPLSCSLVWATNHKKNVHVKLPDRKYLIPTLNNVDLKHVKTQEWIDALIKEWKDPEVLRNVASYLYNTYEEDRSKKFDKNTPQFLELCWVSYPEYLKKFLCLAVMQKTIKESEFKKFSRGTRADKVSLDKLRDFLSDFAVGNKIKDIGSWKHDREFKWVFYSNIVGRYDLIHNVDEFEMFDKNNQTQNGVVVNGSAVSDGKTEVMI